MTRPLAHSAPQPDPTGIGSQTYRAHVDGVVRLVTCFAKAMARFLSSARSELVDAVIIAGRWHDLGKLIEDNQRVLHSTGQKKALPVDHVDSGVSWLLRQQAEWAAYLVFAHHRPGLPNFDPGHEPKQDRHWRLQERGAVPADARELTDATDDDLPNLVARHHTECGEHEIAENAVPDALQTRLALSCLVDADHTDTADHRRGGPLPDPVKPRWKERATALKEYVDEQYRTSSADPERKDQIQSFFDQCRKQTVQSMIACEGPVGIGKTTAVLAYAIEAAIEDGLRRIIVVAPYTAIIDQTVDKLREALTLDSEQPEAVVAAHHHLVDYDDAIRKDGELSKASPDALKDFAQVWRAPVVVTTSVQFFETLAAATPGRLRKLHGLPGSVVILDEAHAMLPMPHWPLAWRWLRKLTSSYSCRVVMSSGTLVHFWQWTEITGQRRPAELPVIAVEATEAAKQSEAKRIEVQRIPGQLTPQELMDAVLEAPGPRLVILNTTASAAAFASELKDLVGDESVKHLSTLLCPKDRSRIIKEVEDRLKDKADHDWTLVATSCVEAGVDFSFRTGFREAWSLASLLQTAGRVNRKGQYTDSKMFSFQLIHSSPYAEHKQAKISAAVLNGLFDEGALSHGFDPTNVATHAMKCEIKDSHDKNLSSSSRGRGTLVSMEKGKQFQTVAREFRVIDEDGSVPVVVDQVLIDKLERGEKVRSIEFELASVSLSPQRINELGIGELERRPGVLALTDGYDEDFLGVGKALLNAAASTSLDFLGA